MFSANASQVSSAANYIEDVFSTYLYTGNGATQTITNGIDLAGKGGLVWIKARSALGHNALYDTNRGVNKRLLTSAAVGQQTETNSLTAFNATGFSLGADSNQTVNTNGTTFASWTFEKQVKFFDIVSYTGTGANTTIAHNLGSVPGCIIVKRTDASADWQVYHRSLANTEYMVLNSAAAKATGTTRWNSTTPTSTVFSVGTDATVNANGGTYVAYLFAHDAGGFGLTGTDNVVSCGLVTTATAGVDVNLGYEPQWLLIKSATTADTGWIIFDTMRGWVVSGSDNYLVADDTAAEVTGANFGYPTSTGFFINNLGNGVNYIYIAIRRGPMKTPTSGTSVFYPLAINNSSGTTNTTGFPVDLQISAERGAAHATPVVDRLRGVVTVPADNTSVYLRTDSTAAEQPETITRYWNNTGFQTSLYSSGVSSVFWNFRRAPGFMDVVCYTGDGVNNRSITHNLGVTPDLYILKRRDSSSLNAWLTYTQKIDGSLDYLQLRNTDAKTDSTLSAPTSTTFRVSNQNAENASGGTYVCYLFGSCTGVSKVDVYTGTGGTLQIDCGFTGGARFVLIKRTDSTGDWYVWDSARGIVGGNDPYLLLNSTAAEVTNTDWVDTYSAGFELSNNAGNNVNINGAKYLYLAIA